MAWRIISVRLRFFLVLAVAVGVVGNWERFQEQWENVTRRLRGPVAPAPAAVTDADTEYWCPMCPGVVADWPMKCPVCSMALVQRRRGDMAPTADGALARMQLSPYRVQLAGIQTAAVEYRPLIYEVVAGGFLHDHFPKQSAQSNADALMEVEAEIYEKDLPLLAPGQRVEILADGSPGRTPVVGQLHELIAEAAASRRRFRARIQIAHPPEEMRPGMYVTVRIQIPVATLGWFTRAHDDEWRDQTIAEAVGRAVVGSPGMPALIGVGPLAQAAGRQVVRQRGLVLVVPDSAVMDTGAKRLVYLEAGPGLFEAVEVAVGPRCGAFRPILSGLDTGRRVVAAGALLLDAETRLNPAVAASYFGAARSPAPTPAAPATAEVERALARLTLADRELALRQKVCPVTGEALGSMGTPIRVEVAGQTVFLCCKGCEADLREKPDYYLSKLRGD